MAVAGAAVVLAAGLGTGAANAAPMGSLPAPAPAPAPPGSSQQDITNFVLGTHDNLKAQAQNLPPHLRQPANDAITNTTNFFAPGALKAREEERRQAAIRAEQERIVAEYNRNNPCPYSAKACVDLNGRKAWLKDGANVTYNPVPISSGKPGQETPRGSLRVTRKVKDEISRPFNNAPMPWSVYFTNHGHAFHEGSSNIQSAGCIHLDAPHAQAFFNALNVGDEVFIY